METKENNNIAFCPHWQPGANIKKCGWAIGLEKEVAEKDAEIKQLKEKQATILENAVNLIAGDTCEKHHKFVKRIAFDEFVALEKKNGCKYCNAEALRWRSSDTLQYEDGLVLVGWISSAEEGEEWTASTVWADEITSMGDFYFTKELGEIKAPSEWFWMPILKPPKSLPLPCSWCHGTGKVNNCGEEYDCGQCGGTGV